MMKRIGAYNNLYMLCVEVVDTGDGEKEKLI